jgi:hypothetical protein
VNYAVHFRRDLTAFLKRAPGHAKTLLFAILVCPLCLLIGLPGTQTREDQQKPTAESSKAPPVTGTVSPTATKWWIKSTSTSMASLNTSLPSGTPKPDNCSEMSATDLRIGIYAYIAPFPAIPNRVRSEPGLSSAFLGQVDPGRGVKVTGGPICTEGYSWWFIETLDSQIRGWTVGARDREQWILPCPDPGKTCAKSLFTATSPPTQMVPQNNSYCRSEQFAAGMFAQVRLDRLLILRHRPYSGEVIGHAGPLSRVTVLNGPTCAGGAIWWEVRVSGSQMTGWTTELDLEP